MFSVFNDQEQQQHNFFHHDIFYSFISNQLVDTNDVTFTFILFINYEPNQGKILAQYVLYEPFISALPNRII